MGALSFLEHPIIIFFMFVVGIYNVVARVSDFSFYLGIFILIMAFVNLILYIKRKSKRPKCEYCGYIALDERELHNHQLTCEKKKDEGSFRKID